ncbi:MAG: hypothetical protein LBS69_03720 [Prevotellaceae bacterium]|nr:hypothetical protein [Prevotellaceae bacterium]
MQGKTPTEKRQRAKRNKNTRTDASLTCSDVFIICVAAIPSGGYTLRKRKFNPIANLRLILYL